MVKVNYSEFDKGILNGIKDGNKTFAMIEQYISLKSDLVYFANKSNLNIYRAIDRRLIALKRKGLIAYVDRKWEIVKN